MIVWGRRRRLRVSDTVTRADSAVTAGSAETGQPYLADAGVGTWGVTENQIYPVTGAAEDRISLDSGVIDGVFATSVKDNDYTTHGPSFTFRGIDAMNYLRVVLTAPSGNGVVRLAKVDTGSAITLSEVATTLVNGQAYTVQVAAIGASITVSLDGVEKIVYTLTGDDATKFTASTCTRVGFRVGGGSTNMRFDNLTVRRA